MQDFTIEFAASFALVAAGAAGKWLVGRARGWWLRRKIELGGTYITVCVWDGGNPRPVRLKGIASLRQPALELKGKARDHERPAVFSWRGKIDWHQRVVAGYCLPQQVLNRGRSSFVLNIDEAPRLLRGSQVAYLSADRKVVSGTYEMRRLNRDSIAHQDGEGAQQVDAFLKREGGSSVEPGPPDGERSCFASRSRDSIAGGIAVTLRSCSESSSLPQEGLAWKPAPGGAGRVALVDGLAVTPSRRREGLATRLLCMALDRARADGAEGALISVGSPANEDLCRVIELLGFEPVKPGSGWWSVGLAEPLDNRVVSYSSGKWVRLKRFLGLGKHTTAFDTV